MSKNIIQVHPHFKLNGNHFTTKELYSVAYSFIKEGEAYEELIGNFLLDWLNESYDKIKLRTSGTTGAPKPVFIEKVKMKASALATQKRFKLPSKTKALLCIPATYVAGRMMLVRAMVLGWEIDTVKPQSRALDDINETYDFCALTPHQLANSLHQIHLIRKLIVGGAPVNNSLLNKLKNIPTKVYETYGMTETVTHIATRRINSLKKTKDKPFKAISDVSFSTNNKHCLVINAPKILNEPIITKDVVELVDETKFFWKGRLDNVINSGGVKIHPEALEKKIQKHLDVPFFLSGIKDQELGQKLIMLVESENKIPKEKLYKQLDLAGLSKLELPKEIIQTKAFNKTRTGKIDRKLTLNQAMNDNTIV